MDVDHHNPRLNTASKNAYSNLHLSTRHCNGSKSDTWPTLDEKKKGLRFLDPCIETDYGVHIFEDPGTFLLWGATPAGKYHIRHLDLNADHLVAERRERHALNSFFSRQGSVLYVGPIGEESIAAEGLKALRTRMNDLIPVIPQRERPAVGIT